MSNKTMSEPFLSAMSSTIPLASSEESGSSVPTLRNSTPFGARGTFTPQNLSSSEAWAQIYSFDFHLYALRHSTLDQQHLSELWRQQHV